MRVCNALIRTSNRVCTACESVASYASFAKVDELSNVFGPEGFCARTRLKDTVLLDWRTYVSYA